MSRSDDLVLARLAFGLFILMALGGSIAAVSHGVAQLQHGLSMEGGIALVGAVSLFLIYLRIGSRIRLLIPSLRREIAVTQGQAMAPLARPQPDSVSETTIAAPIVISLRQDWRYMTFFAVILLATFAFFGGVFLSAGSEEYWKSGIALFSLLSSLVAMIALFGVLMYLLRQELIASETGISLKQGFSTTIIPWSEARLFAVTGTYTPAPDLIRYSLDGSSATIRWWLYTKPPSWMMPKPVTSFEEYDQQMRALLSLVAAKTGLPLLDLR